MAHREDSFLILFLLFIVSPAETRYRSVVVRYKLGDDMVAGTQLGTISSMSSRIPPAYSSSGYYRVIMEPNRFADRYFKVHMRTSALSVRSNIDRDEICHHLSCCDLLICTTRFTVFIRLTASMSIRVIVIVEFKDANDNTPVIDTHFLPLPESTPVGSSKPLPLATDRDCLQNGVQRYRLSDPTGTFYFYSDSSGRPMLRLVKRLDADQRSTRAITLTYAAIDGGSPALTGQVALQVRVVDENDNAPIFEVDSRSEWVKETEPVGTEIYQFRATDADMDPENSRVTYHLNTDYSLPPNLAGLRFTVDNLSGGISIRSGLDYDRLIERFYQLVVEARDHGSPALTSTATLSVHLTNENDNDPRIIITASQPLVEERDPQQRVRTISVQDPDEISSIHINCSLRDSEGFQMSTITENHYFDIVTTRRFDHETQPEVMVTVACTDRKPPARPVYKTLQISVVDINDHNPVFSPDAYSTVISEGLRRDREVLTVRATDEDSGDNGEVRYFLDATGRRYFRVDPLRGIIYVNATLDRETDNIIMFQVYAEDTGNPPLSASASIQVELTDINDNPPMFDSPKSVAVLENSLPGTLVTQIRFKDPDDGPNGAVSFRLVRDKNLALRYLNMTPDGKVVVIRRIDREKITRMYLDICAQDRGVPLRETTAALVVRVLDLNDNRPRLMSPPDQAMLGFDPPLFADSPFNTTVARLVGQDGDYRENGTIVYEIIESNASGLFQMDFSTGRLFTAWLPSNPPVHGIYRLQVRLSDQGVPPLYSEAQLFIVLAPSVGIGGSSLRGRAVSNVVILILILICSVAVATLLIIGILWARARGKRSTSSMAQRPGQYLDYDPAVKKPLSTDAGDTDSELVSNTELIARLPPEPMTDSTSCSLLTPGKRASCRTSQHSDEFDSPYPAAVCATMRRNRSPKALETSISNSHNYRTLGHHSTLSPSFPMDNFASLGRTNHSVTSPSPQKQRPTAMVSAHLLSEVYEDEPRQSDLSYEDSGKGGSVDDVSRLMQNNNNSAIQQPTTSRVPIRPIQTTTIAPTGKTTGRETLC